MTELPLEFLTNPLAQLAAIAMILYWLINHGENNE